MLLGLASPVDWPASLGLLARNNGSPSFCLGFTSGPLLVTSQLRIVIPASSTPSSRTLPSPLHAFRSTPTTKAVRIGSRLSHRKPQSRPDRSPPEPDRTPSIVDRFRLWPLDRQYLESSPWELSRQSVRAYESQSGTSEANRVEPPQQLHNCRPRAAAFPGATARL
ncbi:mechanosensitive channel of smallconductance-like 5 [Striga asiatica]|uniref:Mechanosensitive channel of smallconductance-like 5 n=1 Tax=Striga asiatica TaxID=4170 RepID=A0A5A7RAA9_STRAF|nr:mechanosensitive channel of smallconductance-like 5 [Striga asiatica]